MAASALDIISLDDMKRELGIPVSVTSRDTTITGNVEAGVGYVQGLTSVPMVRSRSTWIAPCFPSDDDSPIDLPYRYVTGIESVKYWQPADSLRGLPGGTVDPDDLGAIRPYRGHSHDGFLVHGPSGGWPEAHSERMEVHVTMRREVASVPGPLRQAAILAARDFFEGQRARPNNDAITILVEPWVTAQPEALERNRRAAAGLGRPGADAFEGSAIPETPVTPPTPTVPTTRYFGMSLDETIVPADFANANAVHGDTGTFPANPTDARYPWVAVALARGEPTEFYRPPNPYNQRSALVRQAGAVHDPNGDAYIVMVQHSLSPPRATERPVRIGFA